MPVRQLGALILAVLLSVAMDNTAEDEKTLTDAGLKSDGNSLIQFLARRSEDKVDPIQIKALITKLGDDNFDIREQTSATLNAIGIAALPDLKTASKSPDVEISRRAKDCIQKIEEGSRKFVVAASIRLLGAKKPEGALTALINYSQFSELDQTTEDLITAITATGSDNGTPSKIILEAIRENKPLAKTICAEALANINPELFKKEALALINSDEPRVRYKVALAFAKLGDKRSIEPLVSSISSVSQWESSLIDHLLRKLMPSNMPPIGLPQPELQKEWAKRTVDTSKIPEALLALSAKNFGKTLVVLLDAGRVIMLDSSNNILWKIDNLQFPLDAQILPDEKVLVAEHQGNKVTERNKKGEIIWEKKIDGPLAVQKLEDGSIFIASKSNIVFVDQKGKEISEFTPPNNEPIMKANIASNGDICLVLSTPQGNAKFVRFDKNKKQVVSYDIDVRTSGGKVDILPNGNSLITEVYGNRVIEFNNDGKEVWNFECEQPVAAVRLPNGNTLVTSMTQMKALEVDPKGKEIWSYKSSTRVTRAFRP
ncbi:MAG: hypothetical protein EBT92_19240 [Planctomycetes bacterium]|nr:hypothetical protein [Planctomycetota bacterium]